MMITSENNAGVCVGAFERSQSRQQRVESVFLAADVGGAVIGERRQRFGAQHGLPGRAQEAGHLECI